MDTMAPPSFLGKLAPELRIAIYGHVFGTSNVIKPSSSTASLGVDKDLYYLAVYDAISHNALDSCILSANKLISQEAIQVLYHNRVVRATFPELSRLLQHKDFVANVEKIEVADCTGDLGYTDCSGTLKQLQRLPRVRSIVILSDCLNLGQSARGRMRCRFIAVPHFVHQMAQLGHATCVDIGRYQLHGEYSKVEVINRKLTEMWSSAQEIPTGYDVWDDLEAIMQRLQPLADIPDRLALTLQTSFRCWVGLHEEITTMEASGELARLRSQNQAGSISDVDLARLDLVNQYNFATLNFEQGRPQFLSPRVQVPVNKSLRKLSPGDDPVRLCWATEHLAANIAAFHCEVGPGLHYPIQYLGASHWAEADGGMHVIEQKIAQQKIAFAGLPNPHYILEPVRKNSLIDYSVAMRVVAFMRLDRLASPMRIEAMEPLEFMQLAHLSIAALADRPLLNLPTGADYQHEADEWSSDLLKRHLLASEWSDPAVVQDMSLEDLRNSLLLLLGRPSLKEIRTDPPEDLDKDLFAPLAWKYGWEYANICAEQNEAGHEIETSSDWEGSPDLASESEWDED